MRVNTSNKGRLLLAIISANISNDFEMKMI